jgi:hypothetical protein
LQFKALPRDLRATLAPLALRALPRPDVLTWGSGILALSISHGGTPVGTPKRTAVPPQVTLYDKLIATIPAIERKGAANPYTSLNGNMFTLLHQSRTLAIRLPAGQREKFLKRYKTSLFEAYGAVMEEYVRVPDSLWNNLKDLEKYLAQSYEYAKTLKPKPTKKKR